MSLDKNPTAPNDLAISLHVDDGQRQFNSVGKEPAVCDRRIRTQRALHSLCIGDAHVSKATCEADPVAREAHALLNHAACYLTEWRKPATGRFAHEIIGNSVNMKGASSNEAICPLGEATEGKKRVAAYDGKREMRERSNRTSLTVMQIAAVVVIDDLLMPEVGRLAEAIEGKTDGPRDAVKSGRAHPEGPVSFANWQREHDISGHLRAVIAEIAACRAGLYQIESSGTVVGTDLDARKGLAREVVARIADLTGKPFVSGHEGSAVQICTDAMVRAHRALRKLAIALMNAVNGMRRFASSSHSSLEGSLLSNSELYPATDEVSSTRCEAIVTTCIQVIGNDCAVFFAGSLGHFGIDTMRPVIVNNLMRSACNLTDGLGAFREFLGEGGEFNNHNAQQYADDVLALMTDIPLMSDYKDEAHLVGSASTHDLKLKPGSLVTSAVNRALFDESVKPVNIVSHGLG